MALTPIKALLFLVGGGGAAAVTAYAAGVFDPYMHAPPATLASAPLPAEHAPAAVDAAAPKPEAEPKVAATPPAEAKPAAATPEILPPSFDIVRVEADGSIVIAGKAAPNAKVEIVLGARVIGNTVAGPEGDFAIVIDERLKPGGYQLVLRSTTPDNVVATSPETAVVSIPDTEGGQVLALVEQPGAPSKLITVPEPDAKAEQPKIGPEAAPEKPAAEAPPVAKPEGETDVAAAPAPEPVKIVPAAPAGEPRVAVEAVEIEGRKIFVAGVADAGRKVRAYANDILLGEAEASAGGRFLIEAERDLPVGDYIIRVDALEPNGVKVVARAAVPFEREPGEAVAAVAPAAPEEKPADPAAQPAPDTAAPAPEASAMPEPAKPAAGEDVTAAPETLAPKLKSVDGAVIIRRGDTLWRISRRVYGRGVRYSTIYLANQTQITDPDRIWPGQVFKVPEKTTEGEQADMKAVGEQATTTQ